MFNDDFTSSLLIFYCNFWHRQRWVYLFNKYYELENSILYSHQHPQSNQDRCKYWIIDQSLCFDSSVLRLLTERNYKVKIFTKLRITTVANIESNIDQSLCFDSILSFRLLTALRKFSDTLVTYIIAYYKGVCELDECPVMIRDRMILTGGLYWGNKAIHSTTHLSVLLVSILIYLLHEPLILHIGKRNWRKYFSKGFLSIKFFKLLRRKFSKWYISFAFLRFTHLHSSDIFVIS